MNNIIFKLMIIQFKILFREPGVVFWVFGFPILMATVLGVAFQQRGGEAVRIGVISAEGRFSEIQNETSFQRWIEGLKGEEGQSEYGIELHATIGQQIAEKTQVAFLAVSRDQALILMKRGIIPLFIEPHPHSITFHFDPQNREARLNYLLLKNALLESEVKPIEIKTSTLSSVGNRYIDFLIPGLMALGIMNSCIWGIGWGLIEMRMKKLLRRIIATPMKKSSWLLSIFLNRFLLSSFENFVLFMFAMMVFNLETQGRVLDIILLIFCGNIAFAGIAILMSSRTESTVVGNGLINLITLPMFIVSGIFFSYHNFPDWSIPIVEILPLTILADTMRSIIIEGKSIIELMIPIISLISIGLVTSVIGLKVYKWH